MNKLTLSLSALAALGAAGCAALPNTIGPELEHMSHATQHAPLTSQPTNYGSEIAQINLHWDLPKRFTLDLAEGVSLDKRDAAQHSYREYGEIVGPREQFTAKIGYAFKIH